MSTSISIAMCVFLVLIGAGTAVAEDALPPRGADLSDAALVVIDIQAFYFPGGKLPLSGPEVAAERAAEVIEVFRKAGRPVIHVQHLPDDVDTPDPIGIREQYRIYPKVLPAEGDRVIGKHHANAFRDTDLLEVLRGLGVKTVVIAGMQTHMCVEAAVRAAADLGFEVIVVHDACATRDLSFLGEKVPSAHVHAAALAAMSAGYATAISAAELAERAK